MTVIVDMHFSVIPRCLDNYKIYHVYANRTQAKKNNSCNFLVKFITHYIKIHYEMSQNANFLH